MRILVLGMGRMGQAIAERLLAEHEVAVWDRTPHKADSLVEKGATEVTDRCVGLRAAEVALTSLSNDDAVREVACGKDGVIECIGEGVYIDTSTISPALSGELAGSFRRFVAMPIVGSPGAMRSGDARLLIGGDPAVIESIEPIIKSLSDKTKHYRSAPQASVAKLATNLILLTGIASLSEAVAVGRAGGLTQEELHDLFVDSPVVSPAMVARLQAVLDRPTEGWWTINLGTKDLRLALDLAESESAELTLAKAAYSLYQTAVEDGLGDEDIAAIARLALP